MQMVILSLCFLKPSEAPHRLQEKTQTLSKACKSLSTLMLLSSHSPHTPTTEDYLQLPKHADCVCACSFCPLCVGYSFLPAPPHSTPHFLHPERSYTAMQASPRCHSAVFLHTDLLPSPSQYTSTLSISAAPSHQSAVLVSSPWALPTIW